MRKFTWIPVAVLVFGLAACGGGSTTGATPTVGQPPALVSVQGLLVTRDGSTDALGGVGVICPETGSHDVTDRAGSFHMLVPHDRPYHLDFDDPRWDDNGRHHDAADEHPDPLRHRAEIEGAGVAFGPLDRDERCEVEVYLDAGGVLECHVRWGDEESEAQQGEHHMDRDAFSDELDAVGEVEITYEDGCFGVEVEVGGFSGPASLDVHLLDPDGEEAHIGTMDVDGEGVGHMELSWCEGDRLPFGAASPDALGGHAVVVYDETGEVVFRGHLPHHRDVDTMPHRDGWEGMDGDRGDHHGGSGDMPHHGN